MYLTSALVRLGERWPPVGLTVAEAVVCALPVIPDLGPGRIPAGACSAPSSRGLGRRPLKAVTPVRIRSGLLRNTSRAALPHHPVRYQCSGCRQAAGPAWP